MNDHSVRLELLFGQLLDLPTDQRERFLREQCGGDEKLAAELLELLSHHDADESEGEFLPSLTGLGLTAEDETDVPMKIGKYRILEEIGSGGMGTVYKAEHVKLRKLFAMKLLSPDLVRNPQAAARFEREMIGVGKFEHPNIVRASDAGESDGRHYLVMEYVDGINLNELQTRYGALPVAAACEVVRQAACGLSHAHKQGLTHRDVKPSNLILTYDGQVKILDFGLALYSDALGASSITGTGQVMGTVDYMAPEQVGSGHGVDFRADIYSLGATLYKLLVGAAPFEDPQYDTLTKRLTALAIKDAPSLARRRPDLPVELVSLVDRMLSKQPNQRPQTIEDFASVLGKYADSGSLTSLLEGDMPATPLRISDHQTQKKDKPSIRALASLGALITIVFLTIGSAFLLRNRTPGTAESNPESETIAFEELSGYEHGTRPVPAWFYLHAYCEGGAEEIGETIGRMYELCERHSLEPLGDTLTIAYLDYHESDLSRHQLTVEIRIHLYNEEVSDQPALQHAAREMGLQYPGVRSEKVGTVAWIKKPKGIDEQGAVSLSYKLFEYARSLDSKLSSSTVPLEEFPAEYWAGGKEYANCETELILPLN